ncbi:uncharacterized protein LOC117333667 [Pecten maximus]|uniref:uncharacterized protein LOC117333667 n=1 Tax=Pecten maximus TaxID=6579 RepID=UPI001458BCBB|nr:uncharacterized protein LOC117333667 [Pecten maximus]
MGSAIVLIVVLSMYTLQSAKCDCTGKADIIFAVPGNLDIPGEEFFPFERFLVMLVDHFVLRADNINVGLVLYGNEPIAVSYPQPFRDQAATNARITLMSQRSLYVNKMYGKSDVTGALTLMRHMFQNPAGFPLVMPRPGVKKIGVLFTYGRMDVQETQAAVNATYGIKSDNVTMYVIGRAPIGPEFLEFGSDPCKLFSMASFIDGLPSLLPYLGSSICTALQPSINVTEQNCFPKFWQPDPNPPVVCPTLNAMFQDPYNCAYYYKCFQNIPIREACPDNMLFDNNIKTCNLKESVGCFTQVQCPQPVGLFRHPFDCTKFVNCFDNIPYIQKCNAMLYFDEDEKRCRDRTMVNCPVH